MAANNQQFGSRSDNPPRKVHEEGLNKSKLVGFAHLQDISPMLAPPFMKNMPMPLVGFLGNNIRDMIPFPIHTIPDEEIT
ncbi:UNVERIFIED_CONTAM: hypothetical protein Sangu_2578500 [Sesamum angustifolium]|uniref:Uncharacterized protein n=1 Tax=Sesamum angustifolium TaxID=2727405 RepID=A0AAW2J783_9LAMI